MKDESIDFAFLFFSSCGYATEYLGRLGCKSNLAVTFLLGRGDPIQGPSAFCHSSLHPRILVRHLSWGSVREKGHLKTDTSWQHGQMDNFTYHRTSFVLDVIATVIQFSTNDILPTIIVQINDSSVLLSKSQFGKVIEFQTSLVSWPNSDLESSVPLFHIHCSST